MGLAISFFSEQIGKKILQGKNQAREREKGNLLQMLNFPNIESCKIAGRGIVCGLEPNLSGLHYLNLNPRICLRQRVQRRKITSWIGHLNALKSSGHKAKDGALSC